MMMNGVIIRETSRTAHSASVGTCDATVRNLEGSTYSIGGLTLNRCSGLALDR